MNKTDILAILREMQLNWTECIAHIDKESFEQIVKLRNCDEGFCNWLAFSHLVEKSEEIEILVIMRDDLDKFFDVTSYWYDTVFNHGLNESDEIYKAILTVRLDHINRTIARLEKQIN